MSRSTSTPPPGSPSPSPADAAGQAGGPTASTGLADATRQVVEAAEARRARLQQELRHHSVERLPLRFWRQQAYYTTPASDPQLARKAVEGGFAPVRRILERYAISVAQLAETFGAPDERVQALLDSPRPTAPLVMLDGEDASAPTEDVIRRARESAVEVFRGADWDPSTLRFYRPNGLDRPWTAEDLATVLLGAGPGGVDGIVFPKADHPEEVAWADETLGAVEGQLGVPEHSIKLALLVESGWAVRNLERLALAARQRLVGLILGIADYSSDVGLPEIRNDHPTADWVRMEMVNVAGAVGVPTIDTMTFDYPVANPALSPQENRTLILGRLKRCYDDALHGVGLGMSGKWVGHPAQLFAVLLAYQSAVDPADVEARIREVEAYARAVADERGATIHAGMMVDRATDRHAREVLRRAVAGGLLDPERALAAGVISEEESSSFLRQLPVDRRADG